MRRVLRSVTCDSVHLNLSGHYHRRIDSDLTDVLHGALTMMRPVAQGRRNWLFAGSLRGGERMADLLSLVHTARLNGLEPRAWLRDVLEKLPSWPASRLEELLPYGRQTG